MAAAIVLLGALLSVGCWRFLSVPLHAAVGLFAGATTNAPALGSAGEALKSSVAKISAGWRIQTGPAFAISYPFGLVGVILAMVIRGFFSGSIRNRSGKLEEAIKLKSPN